MSDDRGVRGHITIEKSRVWDLKSTGQVLSFFAPFLSFHKVSSGIRSFAAISCLCFHPTDPTLCVVSFRFTPVLCLADL